MDGRGAGTLAPLVFSGEMILSTCKIMHDRDKEGPYPPKLTLVNPMVVLVSAKSSCIKRYNEDNENQFKHGDVLFWNHGTHARVQTCAITSQEHIRNVSSYQNITKIKI